MVWTHWLYVFVEVIRNNVAIWKVITHKCLLIFALDSKLKEEANKGAFDRFAKDMKGAASIDKAEQAGLSERYVSK